ncbi:MAG: hypothetical protein SF172_15230 [Burkholderiales bacterium]|nr:hypothetical protein [Burkholderiales bacterium]
MEGRSALSIEGDLFWVSKIVMWLSDVAPERWGQITNFSATRVINREITPQPPTFLSAKEIRRILVVCKAEIRKVAQRLEKARRLLGSDRQGLSIDDRQLKMDLELLLRLGREDIPSQRKLLESTEGRLLLRRRRIGELESYLWPDARSLLPFFLMLIAKLVGNPYSLLHISRDSMVPNPEVANQMRISWLKNRAGRQQVLEFDSTKKYDPPHLIELIKCATERHLALAPRPVQNSLFLIRAQGRRCIPSYYTMIQHLKRFIEEHDLPKFQLGDLRPSLATLHLQKHHNPRMLQHVLNHRDLRTTAKYIDRAELAKDSDQIISDYQGRLLANVKDYSRRGGDSALGNGPFPTIFGFGCTDPLAGTAPGSHKGNPCPQFLGCSRCPGAVVITDSPKHVAPLIRAKVALDKLREESLKNTESAHRFRSLYLPTLRIINEQILPSIPINVLEIARRLSDDLPPALPLEP